MIQATPVIPCGGSGTLLWPLSRTGFRKQFLCLTCNESLFQQAAQRLAALGDDQIQIAAPLIVSGEDHRFLAAEQLREAGVDLGVTLLEPAGRNTAPYLSLDALAATQDGQDPVLVVTPADQTVANNAAFTTALQSAIQAAADGTILILGVKPTQPEAGYGYIQASAEAASSVQTVQRFVEKPKLQTAQQYLQQCGYFWNAGMFVLIVSVWLKALAQFRPDILQFTQVAWAAKTQDGSFVLPGKA
jgi:mannose-1-phosphate guanylyltransferase/mannose-6-phosphate isomerase